MIRIKKGLDLPIAGGPEQMIDNKSVTKVAVLGSDYAGLRPDLQVAVGGHVKRGQVLFTDNKAAGVSYTAPAGGGH